MVPLMWTYSLLFSVPLSLLFTILAASSTKRICTRSRRKILITLLCFFVFSELIKQTIALCTGTHTSAYYPFHYSSTYYFSIALYLSSSPRRKQLGSCTLYVGGVLLFLCMIIAPRAIVGDTASLFSAWFSIHSFFYHIFVLFAFFVMLFNNEYHPTHYDVWRYFSFVLIWAAIALPAARRYHANYAGLLQSFLPPLERLRLAFGEHAYLLTYASLVFFFAALCIKGLNLFQKRRKSHPFRH